MSLRTKTKQLRVKLEMTQAELAKASKITHATISRIEGGQIKELKSEALKRLARALGVSVDYLINTRKALKRESLNNPDLNYIIGEYEKLSYKGKEQMKDYIKFLVDRQKAP